LCVLKAESHDCYFAGMTSWTSCKLLSLHFQRI